MKPHGPTLHDLQARQAERVAELQEREAAFYQKKNRLLRLAFVTFGIFMPLSAQCGTISGHLTWSAVAVLATVGASLALLIVKRGWGIVLGTLTLGCGTALSSWLCVENQWWTMGNGPFSFLVLMFVWLLWVFLGGILGMLSSQFDDDHHVL